MIFEESTSVQKKSGLSVVRIGWRLLSNRTPAREKYRGGAEIIKQKGSFGLLVLPALGKIAGVTPDFDRAKIKPGRIRPKKIRL